MSDYRRRSLRLGTDTTAATGNGTSGHSYGLGNGLHFRLGYGSNRGLADADAGALLNRRSHVAAVLIPACEDGGGRITF